MKLVLHIIRKDIRHLRVFLFVWWGLLTSRTALIASNLLCHIEEKGTFLSEYWLEMSVKSLGDLTTLLLFPLVMRLVLSDTPADSRAFWLSRPISGSRLLVSKSLFLVLTVILPSLVAEVWLLDSQGVTEIDVLRSVPQIVLLILPALTIPMMVTVSVSVREQETGFPWLQTVAASSLVWIVISLYFVLDLTYETLSTSRTIVLILSILAVNGFVIWHQYTNRRNRLSAIVATCGVLLCGLVVQVWPWDFVAAGQRSNRRVIDPQLITARVEEKSLRLDRPVYPWEAESNGSLVLKGIIVLENVPRGFVVVPDQIVAYASFRPASPRIFHQYRNEYIERNERFWQGSSTLWIDKGSGKAIGDVLGGVNFMDAFHLDADRFFRPYMPELLAIHEDIYHRYGGSGAVYSAEVDFLIQRDEFATLRLEKGEHYDEGSDQTEILEVRAGSGSLTVELKESRHRVVPDHNSSRRYFLHNRSKREVLLGDDRTFSGIETLSAWTNFPPMLKINRTTLFFALPPADPPIDPGWFEDAELVRIETESLGRFSKKIRLANLVLKDVPGP